MTPQAQARPASLLPARRGIAADADINSPCKVALSNNPTNPPVLPSSRERLRRRLSRTL
jgi:hypothetical protein